MASVRAMVTYILSSVRGIAAKLRDGARTFLPAVTRLASGVGVHFTRRRLRNLLSAPAHTLWIGGVTCAFAVALGGMFLWLAWQSRQTVIDSTFGESSNLALSVEQFVMRTMETVDLSMRMVAAEAATGTRTSGEIQGLMAEQVRHSAQIIRLMLIGADGRIRASAGDATVTLPDVSRAVALAASRGGVQLFLVKHPIGSERAGQLIVVVRRLQRPDGRFAGVTAAVLSTEYFQRFLSTLHIGSQGVVALYTADGTMLVRQPVRDDYIGRNFASLPLFTDWLPWASTAVFPADFEGDGVRRIVGYQRVERVPAVVYVALSEQEVLAGWRHTTLLQAAVGMVIMVLAGLTAFALDRQFRARARAHSQLKAMVGELEQARIAAEDANRVKSHFLANMSHELRTPLNGIIGFSEVIRDALVGPVPPRYRDYAADIVGCGRHLLGLVNDVLDLSRVEMGRLELNEGRVDLAALAGDCSRLVAERFAGAKVALTVELPPEAPAVKGDELRLKQILLNLLSNAAKFTPAGGRVALKIAMTMAGAVEIAVSDTGIGMKPEDVPLALEPFRQLEGAFNRRYEGAGLGLPLARRLAELHGGVLSISTAPGSGTTVTVTLPAGRVLAPSQRERLPHGPAESGQEPRLRVVARNRP